MNIDELLASERSRSGFSDAERGAIWRGVARTIAAPPPALDGAPDASPPGGASPAASTPDAPPLDPPAPVAPSSLGAAKLVALLAIAAASGAIVGAAVQSRGSAPLSTTDVRASATLPPSPSPAPASSSAVPSVAASALAPALSVDAPSPVLSPRASAKVAAPSSPSHTSSSSAPKDPSLARERTLLDMGRTALARGDAAAALVALDTHAREFPGSQLGQEREVLAIQALASAGRRAEAQSRADAFRARYPHSPFAGVVEETVR